MNIGVRLGFGFGTVVARMVDSAAPTEPHREAVDEMVRIAEWRPAEPPS